MMVCADRKYVRHACGAPWPSGTERAVRDFVCMAAPPERHSARFGHQSYSTTSEEPPLARFNNYRDIPQKSEGVTWQIGTRLLKSSCSCAMARSLGRARHRTGLIITASAMSTPFQCRAGPEQAPSQVCSPMPPQLPIPMSCDRAEYSQPGRPTKRRASGRCTPRPRQPTA